MKESVAVAKEADAKKGVSPTRSDNSIPRLRDEPAMQLGSLRDVIENIRRDGGTPSSESIATHLSGMHTAQRAPALLALQQTHGNRYVQRVVAGIQAKPKVGQLGDVYEQEADRIAEQVMRMPEPQVQRQVEPEEEEEEEKLQTKKAPGQTPEGTPDLESRIQALKGGGQPLPESVRAFFEPRFGHDFRDVRVHSDSQANDLALSIQAKAFTVGQDVVFGTGQYTPGTRDGRHLIAHELTHVVQQSYANLLQGPIQRDLMAPRHRGREREDFPVDLDKTDPELQQAIEYNVRQFRNQPRQLELVLDVLGISRNEPLESNINAAFVHAIQRFQWVFGLDPDGNFGPNTARQMGIELTTEAEYLEQRGHAATSTELRESAERFYVFGSEDLIRRLTAICLAEGPLSQVRHIFWIYYNRVRQYGEEHRYGLKASAAYLNRSFGYRWRYTEAGRQGESQPFARDPDVQARRSSLHQRDRQIIVDARQIVTRLIQQRPTNPYPGWMGQGGMITDLNRPQPMWRRARHYLHLLRAGGVNEVYVKVLLVPSDPTRGEEDPIRWSTVLFNNAALIGYYQTHSLPANTDIPSITRSMLQQMYQDERGSSYVIVTE